MSKNNVNKDKYPHGIQKEVAQKAGVSIKTAWAFFQGRNCSLDTQKRIKKALKEIESEL